MNSPQRPPFGLLTERLSGSAFTAPRHHSLQTWLYRVNSSQRHGDYVQYDVTKNPDQATHLTPDSYVWPTFPVDEDADWISQRILSQTGDPSTKTGLAILVYAAFKDMKPRTVFSSLDGDALIIPQAGTLDIQTELGCILLRQNEVAVIPRGIRYRVTLPFGPARGYICELFQGHFRLPELGPIGSCSLANQRDFQIPTAHFEGTLNNGIARSNVEQWTGVSKLGGRLFSCTQGHTPFDVVAWHGTMYPYKYDLGRYSVIGSNLFDHPDPSIFTVLTAPSNREPGTAVVDFAIIPPRWNTMEDTYRPPYYHRNTMSEFSGAIIYDQDPNSVLNQGSSFKPYGAALNTTMAAHGSSDEDHEKARTQELKPEKVGTDGFTIFLLETECPMFLADWAVPLAILNPRKPREPVGTNGTVSKSKL